MCRRNRCNHHRPSFGLPPAVDNGTTTVTNYAVVPLPCFGVYRLAHRSDDAETFARVLSDEIVTECLQSANSRWCGEEGIDLVFVDDLPTSAAIGIRWYALKHDRGGTICQGAVNDIRVACYPAHICSTPKYFAFAVVKDILEAISSLQ